MNDDNIIGWFSLENGAHVPIKKGESKREATSRFLKRRMSRVAKNKDKYDKINAYKERKATNKFDKLKYKVSADGSRYELGKEEREKVMRKLGRNTDMTKFNKSQDDTKYVMKKEERDKVYKKLGIENYNKGIEDYEKIGNTYIPIRKGENKEDVVKDYKERESNVERIKQLQDRDRALQSGAHTSINDEKDIQEAQRNKGKLVDYNRRAKLMRFTQDNKDLIDKWVDEYDDETHKRVGEKVLRGEGLTAKEYFGFIGSDPKPGSIISEEFPDGEDAIVANDGKWVRKSRIKEYNKNPKANQDAVYSEKDDEEWEDLIRKEVNEKIDRYKKRKSSNK